MHQKLLKLSLIWLMGAVLCSIGYGQAPGQPLYVPDESLSTVNIKQLIIDDLSRTFDQEKYPIVQGMPGFGHGTFTDYSASNNQAFGSNISGNIGASVNVSLSIDPLNGKAKLEISGLPVGWGLQWTSTVDADGSLIVTYVITSPLAVRPGNIKVRSYNIKRKFTGAAPPPPPAAPPAPPAGTPGAPSGGPGSQPSGTTAATSGPTDAQLQSYNGPGGGTYFPPPGYVSIGPVVAVGE